jgi:thioredoxin reductase (NADPH)
LDDIDTFDVIIIGSGPAGCTAAIYSGRARLETLMIAGVLWGGQLMLTTEVENYPGFNEGVLGSNLMDNMRKQAERFGAKVLFDEATDVDFSSRPLKVMVGDRTFKGRSVVIATGGSAKWLGLESETRLRGRGVSTCAVCDAALFKDKRAVVVGGGDLAVEEAIALTKFAKKVTVIHRRDELRATRIVQERAFENEKINFLWNAVILDIFGKDKVEGVLLKDVKSGEEFEMATDCVFIAIGYKPKTEIFRGKIELDDSGFIKVNENTKTSIEGVFVAGEAGDYRYRQAITAAGDGCKAALDVQRYLERLDS